MILFVGYIEEVKEQRLLITINLILSALCSLIGFLQFTEIPKFWSICYYI